MKKAILLLSLFFSLSGIIQSIVFLFIRSEKFLEFIVFTNITPYYFSGLTVMIEVERINQYTSTSASLGLLNLFFYLSFLFGTIIYFFSKYKETKLLLFNFSLIIISEIRSLVFFLFAFEDWTNSYITYRISGITITIVYILLSYFIINRYLNTSEEIVSDQGYLQNSSKYRRFCNYIIDGGFIIVIALGIIEFAKNNNTYMSFFNGLKSIFGDKLGLLIFISLVKIIYYLTYESIFRSTPAKFLTGCYVTDEEGNPPTFSIILKRTLFRLIPFESLSFLMGKNLHDDYSDTYVVNKKTNSIIENRYSQFLAIAFGILLVIYFCLSNKNIFN
ncbi:MULTISPECIES: RDD family protein [Flavobacterium]|uniref:RDD family protein n=1 Tax=Flavobacterium TaxID=237 RepID=UPI0021158227|nr:MULTISPECIES: RDD family protein [Flavobacterium]UUF12702.1 RDD family protein [Flavobacterium panici]